MASSEKIPKAMLEKFGAIAALTDPFCSSHLDEEYGHLVRRALGALARKRPSPLLKGTESVWAAAVVHAVGRVNFLDDPSQSPHVKAKAIFAFFGVSESAGHNKSREIQRLLDMDPFSLQWSLPSRLADNPMVWMVDIEGMLVDIRTMPIEIQRLAHEDGLIPFVPAERQDPKP